MATNLVQASSGKIISTVVSTTTPRRSANYHPSVWGDHFLTYTTCPDPVEMEHDLYPSPLETNRANVNIGNSAEKTDAEVKEHQQLLREVKKMVVAVADEPQKQLNLIDAVQRLGVAYHFEAEIDAALQSMNINTIHQHDDDFHNIALCFRLLRQQGYNVSSDVFHKFKDCSGKFKENLKRDSRGVLSLYEAAHVRVHGEDILDEALTFTTSHLEHLRSDLTNPLATQVIGALKCPIRKSLNRLEARRYISIYHEDENHNKLLLNFAKLDFNLLQKEHQRELGHITRWWKGLNCEEKFPFARDRLVECYFWILGVYFEPQYFMARRFLTKIIALATIADDIYDVYGSFEELVILTDAIERWDTGSLDQLPECMGVFYRALLDVYNEMEKHMIETEKPSYNNCISYAKDSFKELLRKYLAEAKWLHEGHVPTLEEYMSVALLSGGYKMMAIHSFVGMGNVIKTMDVFDWVSTFPLMVKASSIICRLSDDIVGYEVEQEGGEAASAVECYMKQHGVTKQEAYAEFKGQITNAWKDMNKECLLPTAVPMPLLITIYNLTRVINLLYDGEECYTNSKTRTKQFITSVLIDPIVI